MRLFPAEQAALARLYPEDTRLAERFEIFWQGLELANGFRELTDSGEQARRFQADRQRRTSLGLGDMLPDEQLLAALEHGLPECSGVAVGFDRLVMLCLELDDIAGAQTFAG